MRLCLLAALGVATSVAPAQWEDARRLGTGGETFVATDGAGTVYATSHLPTQIFVSRDWGESFGEPKTFPDALGDMVVCVRGKGEATVAYMPPSVDGLVTHAASGFAKEWKRGDGIRGRPLDREWLAYDAKSGALYLNYSDGYIGGPKSKGVFLSQSLDGGLTWKETARIDKTPEGSYAIDPGLACSTDGRIYAMWTTTSDYNTVDAYHFAYSSDGGQSFQGHRTIATVTKGIGDVQERWMLGGVTCHGAKKVCVFYVDYARVSAAKASRPALRVLVRTSGDGGETFGEPVVVTGEDELVACVEKMAGTLGPDASSPFVQCLPWACYDAKGRLHVVWQDNREGRAGGASGLRSLWQVRHSVMEGSGFGESEAVSVPYDSVRPPLDFMSCAADGKFVHVTWTETPGAGDGWQFTGEFWYARKPLG
jgi:hypothetical protein